MRQKYEWLIGEEEGNLDDITLGYDDIEQYKISRRCNLIVDLLAYLSWDPGFVFFVDRSVFALMVLKEDSPKSELSFYCVLFPSMVVASFKFLVQRSPVDQKLIPTGKFESLKGTPYDFLEPREVGSRINDLAGLYDMSYVLDGSGSQNFRKVVIVREKVSGRKLEIVHPGETYKHYMVYRITAS
ncbi:hypothetical protein VNO78_02890 [Psophocarpus tetragonolobus]|uniref:Uncharacterized protein n=1 Tax=Psophocarpus tetragonolobus TaxID=3891 RepID=A0AAN9T3D4_PSOTE